MNYRTNFQKNTLLCLFGFAFKEIVDQHIEGAQAEDTSHQVPLQTSVKRILFQKHQNAMP